MTLGLLHSIWLSMFAFDKPAEFEFQQEEVLRWAERQLVNFGAPEIAIYLHKYVRAHSALVLSEQTHIAATRLFG